MKRINVVKTFLPITFALVIIAFIVSHYNLNPLQRNRIFGIPDGHVRVVSPEPSYFDLLFSRYGTLYFNHYGDGIHVYVAYYMEDELVFHQNISGFSWGQEDMLSGTLRWGTSASNGLPDEVVVAISSLGNTQNRFDMEPIDFEVRMFTGPLFESGEIRRGERNVLALWSGAGYFWADGNMFESDRLIQSGHTAILYVVFE